MSAHNLTKLPLVQRAFEIARNSPYSSLKDLRSQLKREGYDKVEQHLDGSLAKQLRAILTP